MRKDLDKLIEEALEEKPRKVSDGYIAQRKSAVLKKIGDSATAVNQNETGYHSHATFSSNSTSYGNYGIQFDMCGLDEEQFSRIANELFNTMRIPTPRGSIYSSVSGAKPNDLISAFNSGNYTIEGNYLTIHGLSYKDVFIGD